MRIIDTGITKEMLTGDNCPQIKIVDKLYTVDDRQKAWDKIQEIQKDESLSETERTEKIYDIALGKDARKEIMEMNIPVEKAIYLSYCIMGAITGEEPDKLLEEARKQKN